MNDSCGQLSNALFQAIAPQQRLRKLILQKPYDPLCLKTGSARAEH